MVLLSRFFDAVCFDVIVRAVCKIPLSKGRNVAKEAAVIPRDNSIDDHMPMIIALP
jgi:hypothetical protein